MLKLHSTLIFTAVTPSRKSYNDQNQKVT